MKAVIAVNNLGFIGLDDELPWKNSKDFKHFKKMTMGGVLLVGYNTYQKLPPLKGRTMLLDDRETLIEDITDVADIDDVWCIGGKKTYEKYVPWFKEIHISHIDDNTIGDTTFPNLIGLDPLCEIFNYRF